MKLLVGIAATLAAVAANPQPATPNVCNSPESRQLDFWLGDWELAYVEDGKRGTSRNHVTKILDGCAVLEEFSGAPGSKLDGKSFSTFDRATGKWKQTWVDNTSSYLDFTGGMADGKMILVREAVQKDGRRFHQRMAFHDIEKDSLKWLWQKSEDGGKTWATQWEIDYKRVK
ncbi:MAG: DUF1579 family protein [Usitatibacter sp.]